APARAGPHLGHDFLSPGQARAGPQGRHAQGAVRGRDQEELRRVCHADRCRDREEHHALHRRAQRDPRRRPEDLLMMPVWRAALAYLVGCVPAASLVAALAQDWKHARVAVALTDFLKGLLAVLFLAPVGLGSISQALVLTALVAGDQWPAWGRERGRLG